MIIDKATEEVREDQRDAQAVVCTSALFNVALILMLGMVVGFVISTIVVLLSMASTLFLVSSFSSTGWVKR